MNRPFRRRLARNLAAVFALGLWPAAARAWTYSEHRQITARGIETLDPQKRAELDRLWERRLYRRSARAH